MNKKTIHKILVSNRGEIALRIIKAIRVAGIQSIAIYTEADKNLPFVHAADQAIYIGNGNLQETYLNAGLIVEKAMEAGVDAIHPGYGFLSENADFANLCRKNGLIFIGPSPEAIELMGNKSNARESAKKAGVPVIEGLKGSVEELLASATEIKFPVLIKPSAGGGGKGMRIVERTEDLNSALSESAREALNYFGSDELYLEHFIGKARHIEVQILADNYGNTIHLFERECTLQRRYQKIIEEAPSVSLSDDTRIKLCNSAVKLADEIKYSNAGTVEFLVDEDENFYFIEMNTRIQVEHPVSELVTGFDIVAEQIQIARGEKLRIEQSQVKLRGHAIEARIYAEDPEMNFLPSTGKIEKLDNQNIIGRIDAAYAAGNTISPFYDPMIAKVISHGMNRQETIQKLKKDIENYRIKGLKTNRSFLLTLMENKAYHSNDIYTRFIDVELKSILDTISEKRKQIRESEIAAIAASFCLQIKPNEENVWQELGHWRRIPVIQIKINDNLYRLKYRRELEMNTFAFHSGEEDLKIQNFTCKGAYCSFILNNKLIAAWIHNDGASVYMDISGETFTTRRMDIPDPGHNTTSSNDEDTAHSNEIKAPLNGRVVKILKPDNGTIEKGEALLVIESMKMENKIIAPRKAEIEKVHIKEGELVELNKLLITLK